MRALGQHGSEPLTNRPAAVACIDASACKRWLCRHLDVYVRPMMMSCSPGLRPVQAPPNPMMHAQQAPCLLPLTAPARAAAAGPHPASEQWGRIRCSCRPATALLLARKTGGSTAGPCCTPHMMMGQPHIDFCSPRLDHRSGSPCCHCATREPPCFFANSPNRDRRTGTLTGSQINGGPLSSASTSRVKP